MAPPPGGSRGRRQPRPMDLVVRYTKRLNRDFAERGDVDGATGLIEAMVAEGVAPTLVTMNTLIKCYRNARRPDGAETTLHGLRQWGLTPDGCSYCTVIDAWGLAGKPDEARRVLSEAEANGMSDTRTYSALMRFVPWPEVETLMQRMAALGVPPDLATCNAALNTLATAGQPEAALTFVEKHMRPSAYAPAGQRAPPSPDQRTYSILLKAFCACGKAAQAEGMLRLMLANGFVDVLDVPAFSTVMNALVSSRPANVAAAESLMRDAEAHGLTPDTQMYNLLIKGYASCIPPQPEAARATLERIIAAGLTPSIASLTSVMDAFCEANDVDAAAALARHFSEVHGLVLTEPVYNVLIKGYARCRCKRSNGVCHCVVCTCCQPNAGMKILEQMAMRGLVPDAVTINTLIDAHCNAGQLAQAWLLLESICIGGGGLAGRQGAGGLVHLRPGAVQPNLTGFRTAFRAMVRHVSDTRFSRADRRRRDMEDAPAAAGSSDAAVVGPPALPRELLLQMLADGLGLLLATLGPKNDESLSSTLHTLGRALVPNWQAPSSTGGSVMSEADLVRLKDEAEAALHMSACIPEGLVSPPRDVAGGMYVGGNRHPPRYLYMAQSSQPDPASQQYSQQPFHQTPRQPQPHYHQPLPPPQPETFQPPPAAAWQFPSSIHPDQAQWQPQGQFGCSSRLASACALMATAPPYEPRPAGDVSEAAFHAAAPSSANASAVAAAAVPPAAAGTGDRLVVLRIDNMHCDGCASGVSRALHALPRVRVASVDYATGIASVRCMAVAPGGNTPPGRAGLIAEPLIAAIDAMGFPVQVLSEELAPQMPAQPCWGEAGRPAASGPTAPQQDEAEVLFLRRRVEQLESRLASFGISA